MNLDWNYAERVYAGVLGKIIGVYLGRPFEQWSNERIERELGEIQYYVHDRLGKPLVVTDDDITGTFTFVRAVEDVGKGLDLTAEDIGEAWLNYVIERRTIFWWGGFGHSTEHTAYLRLKAGFRPPESGSIALNGPIVAQQIGAQIFIDAWAMLVPEAPERAAELARKAASVSHDGEAIYGAQVIAAMESAAFVESDLQRLLDIGVSVIPGDSTIARMIADLRQWRLEDSDWRTTLGRIHGQYGYGQWPGGCHVVPNHAIVILALLYGDGDFQRSLMIANTAGYDTDCNSGNVGCLLGIQGGLAAIDQGPDWRGPVADRMMLPTGEGGRAMTDAATEALRLANLARKCHGLDPLATNARFAFPFDGCVHGFALVEETENGGVRVWGDRGLRIGLHRLNQGHATRVERTLYPAAEPNQKGYGLVATPTLYPGQTIRVAMSADQPVDARLYTATTTGRVYGPSVSLGKNKVEEQCWEVPDLGGEPVCALGIEMTSHSPVDAVVHVRSIDWTGCPHVQLRAPSKGTNSGWLSTLDQLWHDEPYTLIQNEGTGLMVTGTEEWRDYTFAASIAPALANSFGIIAAYGGLRRYLSLESDGGFLRLVRNGPTEERLGEWAMPWPHGEFKRLGLTLEGADLSTWVDGRLLGTVTLDQPLAGGVGLVLNQGRIQARDLQVSPGAAR